MNASSDVYDRFSYDAGVSAFRNGRDIADCPYTEDSVNRPHWLCGYEYARENNAFNEVRY
jgi:ribosome modulation factor